MLGRTDSRRRLLFLLVVFCVATVALIARLAYWQVIDRERLASQALAQTTVTHRRAEQARRHLRPDRHGRPGHDRPARAARRGARPADPGAAQGDRRDADGDPRPRPGRGDDPARHAQRQRQVRHPAPRPRPRRRRPDPRRHREQSAAACRSEPEPERVYPQLGGGPGSSLAAHLLGFVNREGGGQYGVEQAYQATLAGEPRVVVAERDASGQARPRRGDRVRAGRRPART